MKVRKASPRPSTTPARLRRGLAVAAACTVAGCAALVLQARAPEPGAGPGQKPAATALPAVPVPAAAMLPTAATAQPLAARRIYPYSIVPGGVRSHAELAHAAVSDKAVAAHYAGFAVDQASLRSVAAARAVYVSYRKGDQVYWTAHKVTLGEGEQVWSDGRSEIRARCGNRIAGTPQLPVEVKGPDERELDTPLDPGQDAGDGALRETAFVPEAEAAESAEAANGQPFALRAFAEGAGLRQGGFGNASLDQASLASLAGLRDAGATQALLASLGSAWAGPASRTVNGGSPAGGTADSGKADSQPAKTGGAPDTGAGSTSTASTVSTAEAAMTGAGDEGAGGKPGAEADAASTGAGSAKPTMTLPPTGSSLSGNAPARTHELPEPGSLWLAGIAAVALLLRRRP